MNFAETMKKVFVLFIGLGLGQCYMHAGLKYLTNLYMNCRAEPLSLLF